ncbi:MAG TPA: hypothetical protein VHX61_01215 [Rhizomicrobium sp.]|jgi:hypothetical protein|nr:hypothetical protein [Rhizomicrobium sp.]
MSIRKRTWKNSDGVESTSWIVDVVDANGRRERRQFESRKEADAFRVATEGQIRAGTFRGDASKFTVKDAADRFLTSCDGRRERGERMTRRNYQTMDGISATTFVAIPSAMMVRPDRKDSQNSMAGSAASNCRNSPRVV